MKSLLKVTSLLAVVAGTTFSAKAQITNDYIQNNTAQAQNANFWITGWGKYGNGVVLPKEGYDGVILGVRLSNVAETRGANLQLTGGTNPGLATWIHDGTNWVERMRITSTGYIGINAQAPGRRMDIVDTSSIVYTPTGAASVPPGGIVQINNNSAVDGSAAHFFMSAVNGSGYRNAAYIGITSNKGTAPAPDIVFGQRTGGLAWGEAMRIKGNGNVGIGTIDPGTNKLAVEGTIGARRVKVTQTSWADFVFEPDYQLPSLADLESYIKANKHLPDVPSAKEVAKDGVDLGEMNRILLQKIEELTLHVIEESRRNKELEEKMRLLEKKLEELQQR